MYSMGSRSATIPQRKKMVEITCRRQITTTPYANKTYHPKPRVTLKKRNLVQFTKPERTRLTRPRKINMQNFPSSTSSQLNWKSTTGRSHTQEAMYVAHCALTNLAPMQGSQLVDNTPSHPHPFTYSLFKSCRRLKILYYMYTIRQGLPRQVSNVF